MKLFTVAACPTMKGVRHVAWAAMFRQVALLLQLVTATLCSTITFIQEPQRFAVLEGRSATMACTVSNLQPYHVVLWYRSGILLSNGTVIVGHQLDPSRYAIMVNANSGQYNLHISAVSPSDDHSYRCVVNSLDHGEVREVLRSEAARLEVYNLPANTYPECLPLAKPNFTEGESATISCKSERANPPVILTWKRGIKTISQVDYDDTETGFRSLRHTFVADSSLNGAFFECHLSSAADSDYVPLCSLGPLNVIYKPRVELERQTELVYPDEEVTFQCNAEANPRGQYEWIISPQIPEERTRFESDKRHLIITAHKSDNGTTITCNVSNTVGSTSASVLMTVLPERVETTENPRVTILTSPTSRPKTSTDIPPYQPGMGTGENVTLNPEILAIIIGIIGLLILIVLVITLGYLCRCFPVQHKGTYDGSVYGSTFGPNYGPNERPIWDQTSIYFEPKDHLKELSTWQRTNRPVWQRNVSVQVPHVEEEDPPYQEIGQDWDDGTYTMQI
ncbi:kin of IRRE-like protein 1 [Diadema setosum]|uniref:kin of IRRE-like protein 1 n=1 Tax=Diadema setosum TaxID=31175 RepID=UPI003B3B715F